LLAYDDGVCRRIAAPVLSFIVLALAGCASLGRGAPVLRVLVYNIHAGKDAAGGPNLQRVADLVRSTRADLVLLQEVDRGTQRSGKVDQVHVLMDRTGLAAVFGRTLDYDGGTYGIAMLSRGGYSFNDTMPLPVTPSQTRAGGSHEPRGALVTIVRTRIGRLHAITTHLDASREDTYRVQEAGGLIGIVNARRSNGTPLLLGGDFNSEPPSAVQQQLRAAGLRDAWSECGHGDGLTYPADKPVKRIDYLFLTATLACTDARVIDSQASDHRPLMVTVVLRTASGR
jgi:endonuclease/exonuclease/phosphatase family metal-dependent hydrolase